MQSLRLNINLHQRNTPCQKNFQIYNRPQKWQIPKLRISFMELPPQTSLDCAHAFCGPEREHAKCVLELSRHFTGTLTVCAPSGRHESYAISLALSKISFQWCKFNFGTAFISLLQTLRKPLRSSAHSLRLYVRIKV